MAMTRTTLVVSRTPAVGIVVGATVTEPVK
jgi:hypothetical protein